MPEEIFNFDRAEDFNTIFVGNMTTNLSSIERTFGVCIKAKDLKLKISSKSNVSINKVVTFLNGILLAQSSGKKINQTLFNQMLNSFQKYSEKDIKAFFSGHIKVGKKKNDIFPRTVAQLEYTRQIKNKDIVFGIGPAGTGKTYLAMAMGISEFLSGKYARMILTRPAKEAGESLGFLPGTLEEKIMPYLRPLYDALYDMLEFDEVTQMMEKHIIEVAPLAFMRGRTLNHSFIILDEAQNTTKEQMLMFLTRIGFDSKCVITGDPTQTDLEGKKISGLIHAQKILSKIHEIGFSLFSAKDVVRHPLVETIIDAYSKDKKIFSRKNKEQQP